MATQPIDIRNGGLKYETTRELVEKQALQRKYTQSWVWRSVASLIDVSAEARSPKWMSEKLGVGVAEIVDALEGLEKLGIIRRTEAGYERILKYVYFSSRDLSPTAVLTDHVLISQQILNRLDPHSKAQQSFYRTGFVATNEALTRDFCLKIEALMKEFLEASAKAPSDQVVAFTFSNLKVSRDL